MIKIETKFLNYILTIGFIFFIIIFLSSMILISRSVLNSEQIPLKKHFDSTKNILNDLKEVESITKNSTNQNYNLNVKNFLQLGNNGFKISKPYIINLKNNSSIFTFYINGKIGKKDNIYYKIILNKNLIKKNDIIIYNKNKTGIIITRNNNNFKILNRNSNQIEKINSTSILGQIFLEN